MKEAMQQWLNRFQITFDMESAKRICGVLGLEEDKIDDCLGLCYRLDKGEINEAELTVGLGLLANKEPDEVVGVLRDAKPEVIPVTTEVTKPQQTLLNLLSDKPIHIDELAKQANLGIAQTSSDLALLIIQGKVEQVKGTMTYVKPATIPKAEPVTSTAPATPGARFDRKDAE